MTVPPESICMLESLLTEAPSRIRAVPATFAEVVPISLMDSWLVVVSDGFAVILPGSSCITSLRLEGCICSSVWDDILEDEDISPPSLAVTTTSSSERLKALSLMIYPEMSSVRFSFFCQSSNPRKLTTIVICPAGRSFREKRPSASVTAQRPASFAMTYAIYIGSPLRASVTRPEMVHLRAGAAQTTLPAASKAVSSRHMTKERL